MLGMTVALGLARAGSQVTLLEGAPFLGGLVGSWQLNELVWERNYHVVLPTDSHTLALLGELGLAGELQWAEPRSSLYAAGRMHPVSSALEFLSLPALGWVDKLRLAATFAYGSWVRDWEALESIPVEQWLTRLSGRRAFESFWLPLLRAKLGESYRETTAVFIWASIQRLCATRRAGLARAAYGQVRGGGYTRIVERFESALRDAGVRLELGSQVRGIRLVEGRLLVDHGPAGPEPFGTVVVTAPARVAARMCPDLNDDELARLSGVRYQGLVCASLLLEKPLCDCYLTYLAEAGLPFTAVVSQNALLPPEGVGSHTLIYLPRYVPAEHSLQSTPDDEIRRLFLDALERIYPSLRGNRVVAFRVSRAPHVFPIQTPGYSKRLPGTVTSIPGLYLVNSAQLASSTLNVDETVRLGREAVQLLAGGASPEGANQP